jgi:hypothetical protein
MFSPINAINVINLASAHGIHGRFFCVVAREGFRKRKADTLVSGFLRQCGNHPYREELEDWACGHAAGFGVRGLGRAFGRRLVAVNYVGASFLLREPLNVPLLGRQVAPAGKAMPGHRTPKVGRPDVGCWCHGFFGKVESLIAENGNGNFGLSIFGTMWKSSLPGGGRVQLRPERERSIKFA